MFNNNDIRSICYNYGIASKRISNVYINGIVIHNILIGGRY